MHALGISHADAVLLTEPKVWLALTTTMHTCYDLHLEALIPLCGGEFGDITPCHYVTFSLCSNTFSHSKMLMQKKAIFLDPPSLK